MSGVLIAAAVMLYTARLLASSGALAGSHGAPLRKLALGLGAGCGAAGCFAVGRLGGDARRWVDCLYWL